MPRTMLRNLVILTLAIITLHGCSAANYRPNFERLTPSSEHFTITVTVPEEHKLEANTYYLPIDGACPAIMGALDLIVGLQPTEIVHSPDSSSVSYSFDVPLHIVNAGCRLFAFRPTLTLTGPTGASQKAKEEMFILMPDEMYEVGVAHEAFRSLNQLRICSYTIHSHARTGDVSETLSCRTHDEQRVRIPREYPRFAWDQLQDENIHFTFELDPAGTPKDPREWVNTAEGYRACAREGSGFFCTTPPQFRQFKMDGKLCDVYPGCTLPD